MRSSAGSRLASSAAEVAEGGSVQDARRTLTTGRIVFLVIAAAAPIAAMVGNLPLALKYGNGSGLPAAFAIAAIVLLCFSVGYARMSRDVVNTGAFYTFVARGLGKPPAVAAAYLAVLSYTALTAGLVGAFGYFLSTGGVDWHIGAVIAIVVVGLLGYRSADVSAKVLGGLMVLEFLVLIVLDIGIAAHHGTGTLPLSSVSASAITHGSVGIGLMFAFTSFVGFESAALYGEETKDPERAIPRATYLAVISIGIFYFITVWCIVGAGGGQIAKHAVHNASKDDPLGKLVLNLGDSNVDNGTGDVMGLIVLTSVLASMVAVHNAASRYLFALGREGVLPRQLGTFHSRHLSPHVGSLTVTGITTAVFLAFSAADLDPYHQLAASMVGLSTLGVVLLQGIAAIAVIVYFRRRKDANLWATVVAPGVGAIGLLVAFALAVVNFGTLVDTPSEAVRSVPYLLVVALVGGFGTAFWVRKNRPVTYAALAESQLRERPRTLPRPTEWTRTYCLVGAGPSGLLMARRLLAEGIPFDWYERHDDVGGIWDADAPGSPMYESAHFISSKLLAGFVGHPMPADYPDYPSWRQVLDYIRDFADTWGLREHVTFGVEVTEAVPVDEQWEVTLSTGETYVYDGVIAAPGVNWHASTPEWPGQEVFKGKIRHTNTYRHSKELAGKRVLVVGAGNSGVDIACDAAVAASRTFLSVRRGYRFVPKHIGGVPTDALIEGIVLPPPGVSLGSNPSSMVDAIVGDVTRWGLPKPDHELLATHPIMNTQVLHHLAHGDVIAKPDVVGFTRDGVEFADGSHEPVDIVLAATGFEWRLPFLPDDLFEWRGGRPIMKLGIFPGVRGLSVLGMVEFAEGAAYKRFEEMAMLIVLDITARELGGDVEAQWRAALAEEPDLRGGRTYVDSPRHASYVDSPTYARVLAELRSRFGTGPATAPARPLVDA